MNNFANNWKRNSIFLFPEDSSSSYRQQVSERIEHSSLRPIIFHFRSLVLPTSTSFRLPSLAFPFTHSNAKSQGIPGKMPNGGSNEFRVVSCDRCHRDSHSNPSCCSRYHNGLSTIPNTYSDVTNPTFGWTKQGIDLLSKF
jgi:hypothetical protein